jgi:hypothetical protein
VVTHIDAAGAVVDKFFPINQLEVEERFAQPFEKGVPQQINRIHG